MGTSKQSNYENFNYHITRDERLEILIFDLEFRVLTVLFAFQFEDPKFQNGISRKIEKVFSKKIKQKVYPRSYARICNLSSQLLLRKKLHHFEVRLSIRQTEYMNIPFWQCYLNSIESCYNYLASRYDDSITPK